MQPPDTRRRKADAGDAVTFCLDDQGMSQYWAHNGHTGVVREVELRPQRHRQAPRAIYVVECECGLTLHPRATSFEVNST
jgi:hypothetical protein